MRRCCWVLRRYFLLVSCIASIYAVSGFSRAPPQAVSSNHRHPDEDADQHHKIVILGGAGSIGTAVAAHLLFRAPQSRITLVGRRAEQGHAAIQRIWNEYQETPLPKTESSAGTATKKDQIHYVCVKDVWKTDDPVLCQLVQDADCVIHTAGPFLDQTPTPLFLALDCHCPVYVDISDPVDFLETSLSQNARAQESGTTALLAAGAFPGLSNVLAMEAAASVSEDESSVKQNVVNDVRFHYFTAGLGGSGPVNLYITNLGFGEPMAQFDNGQPRFYPTLSGRLLGEVDFFLPTCSAQDANGGFGNEEVRERVGRRQVFAWPFPECYTVPRELDANGSSWACMGTAPDLWNVMLDILVNIVPRPLWRNQQFSKFMADFSQPLVFLTDQLLKLTDVKKVGETHAMRVDVTVDNVDQQCRGNNRDQSGISVVQAHDSFRQCVGQSCAEFALDCLQYPDAGVRMTEQRYRLPKDRRRIISKLTSTPGTFAYTGPVPVDSIQGPSNLVQAITEAEQDEQ